MVQELISCTFLNLIGSATIFDVPTKIPTTLCGRDFLFTVILFNNDLFLFLPQPIYTTHKFFIFTNTAKSHKKQYQL